MNGKRKTVFTTVIEFFFKSRKIRNSTQMSTEEGQRCGIIGFAAQHRKTASPTRPPWQACDKNRMLMLNSWLDLKFFSVVKAPLPAERSFRPSQFRPRNGIGMRTWKDRHAWLGIVPQTSRGPFSSRAPGEHFLVIIPAVPIMDLRPIPNCRSPSPQRNTRRVATAWLWVTQRKAVKRKRKRFLRAKLVFGHPIWADSSESRGMLKEIRCST